MLMAKMLLAKKKNKYSIMIDLFLELAAFFWSLSLEANKEPKP